jgi:hypothetical protein
VKPAEPSFDLPRLDASTQPRLTEAVATLRSHGPDATELASLASRLALAGVDVTLPAPPTPRASVRWKKWLAGGGAASGALIWLLSSAKGPPPPLAATPNAASHALAVEVEARAQAPGGVVRASSPARSGAVREPDAPSPLPLEVTQPTLAVPPEGEQATSDTHEAATSSAEHAPSLATTAAASAAARAPSNGATRDGRGAQLQVPELRAVPSEIELLRDARLALKQAPARALELVEAHARAYPGGKLTQERELIGISALVALGRHTAALSRGARFQQNFPSSPYRDQVEQLLR